jgi:hypothetical protein
MSERTAGLRRGGHRVEREPTPEVRAALAELQASRDELRRSLDEVTSATQSALDVPAKIRRSPVKAAALVGGAGFLLAGGPRRVMRFAAGRIRPGRPDPYAGLLPTQIEQILKDNGLAADPGVRRALEQDFAEYLRSKGRYDPAPTPTSTFWRTFDKVSGPLGTAGARVLVLRIMEAERDRARARDRARKDAPGPGPTG